MEVVISSRPRPKPRPVSPGTIAEHSPDSDDGFNIGKNRRRLSVHNARHASRLSLTLNPQVPVEEASNSTLQPPAEGIPVSVPNLVEDVRMSVVNSLEAEEGEEGNSEEGDGRPDSDFERRVLNRAVQLGLDPNDRAVRELLRHGRPGFAVGFDQDGSEGCPEERASLAPVAASDQPGLEQQLEDLEGSEDGDQGGEEDQGDEEDQDDKEDQGDEEDEEDGGGPATPYELNYNNWSRYTTHGFRTGKQTAVDCLTRYRATGDKMWLPLPHNWLAPRIGDPQQEGKAKLHKKLCFKVGLPPNRHFGALLESDKVAQEAAMNKEAKRREVEVLKVEAARKERTRGQEEEALKERARRQDEAAKREQARKNEAGKRERAKQDEGAVHEQVGRLEAVQKKEAAKKGSLLSRKQIQSNLYKLGMAME